jgi:hypothetical protein
MPQARLYMGTHSALYYGDLATTVTDMAVMAPQPEAQVTRARGRGRSHQMVLTLIHRHPAWHAA